MYYKNRKGRLSPREQAEAINRAHEFTAGAMEPDKAAEYRAQFVKVLPPKRNKVVRPVDGKPAVPLESAVNDAIFDAFKSNADIELWRNNRGLAVYGNKQVRYGVGPKGASDWIGYRRIVITAEHIGTTIAQFAALEVKRPGERPDENQQRFIDRVNADGGRAGWADSPDKAKDVLL